MRGLSPVNGKRVEVRFDGGLLSSDGGVLALREIEKRLAVADRLAACLVDPRRSEQVTHSFADMVRFRLLMIAAGCEDAIDANALRCDPVFKMALDATPSQRDLCSQSTISRLENLPDARALLRMCRAMVDLYCASFAAAPERITLDLDDTFDALHSGQQLALFNAHYDEYGFQPLVVFDGQGRFVTAVLQLLVEQEQRVRPAGDAMLFEAVASDLEQCAPFGLAEEVGVGLHANEWNPTPPIRSSVFGS